MAFTWRIRGKNRSWLLASLLLSSGVGFALAGCSLTREKAECESTDECREALGTGYVCADNGLCLEAPVQRGCTDHTPGDLLSAPDQYIDYVVLGSLLRRTGKQGARQDSALLAMEAVNGFLKKNEGEYPKLKDLRFGMVQCDHDGDTEEIASRARYLSETLRTPLIIGPASSTGTDAAFREVNLGAKDGEKELRTTLFISPSATSVALTSLESESPGLLWRTAPVDIGQGALMGAYAVQVGNGFAVLYENTPYGVGLYETLLVSSGLSCKDCGIPFEADTSDKVPLALALASDEAVKAIEDARTVFFIGAQESHIRQMMELLEKDEFADKMMFFSDAAASADTISAIPKGHEDRVIGTRVSSPQDNEALRFFTGAYEGRHDESPLIHSFTANAYDAAWLAMLGVIQSRLRGDPVTAVSIAKGMRKVSDKHWADRSGSSCPTKRVDDKCVPITLDASNLGTMIDTLTEGEELDVQGASGSLDYCKKSEELEYNAEAFEIWTIETLPDGETQLLTDSVLSMEENLPPCPE